MARRESTQHVLDRVRKPRVHLTYDVETGGAMELKELPFVVGVMADLSGKPVLDDDGRRVKVKDRKFKRIDRDNFNDVMASMSPSVALRVANRLTGDEGAQLNVDLNFKNMDDFDPENIVNQVEPLRKILEARRKLSDLKTKLDGNDKLDQLLVDVLNNSEKMDELKRAMGVDAPAAAPASEEPAGDDSEEQQDD